MKVAMVSEHASPLGALGGVDAGGQNVHVAALARAVAAAGHEVVVHTRRDDPAWPEYVEFDRQVRVHHVDAGPAAVVAKDELFGYMPRFAHELQAQWRRWMPDVVHSHFWMSGWAAARAAPMFDVPVVHTYHALGSTKRSQQGLKDASPHERLDIERRLAQACDRIVATSTEEVFEVVRMGADPSRVTLVPCGVDLGHFSARPVLPTGEAQRVLVVSRLVERKGIGNVVEALADLPRAQLVVAGGPERHALSGDAEFRRLQAIARRNGVADRVEFLGRVERDALPDLYRSAAVVACVPWYEPFGLVALEAMACGRPVVAAAVGGLVDTVIDGVTGLLVPPRDPTAIAQALAQVLHQPTLARSLGRAGAKRARDRYGWPAIATETIAAYGAARHDAFAARAVG